MADFYKKLIENNKKWVQNKLSQDPEFFKTLSENHNPPLLWIGCADSRVPANEITGTLPGEVFVHRNIANMVVHTDMNMLSVLDYAVNTLKIEHIIVCGHYGCGGVKAAMEPGKNNLTDNWIRHIKDVYRFHFDELEAIVTKQERFDRFVELNVTEQVYHLAKTSIVQKAWRTDKKVSLYGWVYGLSTGLIKDLNVTANNNNELKEIYES
ncbi:carbonate dehydratase [Flavobacteriaceae bacterium PRS1]|jgi:carbonic anhydrase|nr:carbonate dehydratase [Flavobacteriaceae bacterium PRS1]